MFWYADRRTSANDGFGSFCDSGLQVVEAESLREASEKMEAINKALRIEGANHYVDYRHQSLRGPFDTKREAEADYLKMYPGIGDIRRFDYLNK